MSMACFKPIKTMSHSLLTSSASGQNSGANMFVHFWCFTASSAMLLLVTMICDVCVFAKTFVSPELVTLDGYK